MFDPFGHRRARTSNTPRKDTKNHCFVFWPTGERERFVVDPWRCDMTALNNARAWLEILSLNGTFVRASVATNRLQTLTTAVATPSGRLLAVRVSGAGDEPLASVAVFGRHHDPADAKAALSLVAHDARLAEPEVLQVQSNIECGIAIATFGAKTDAAVDEAYGLGIYLGAAMNAASGPR